MLRRRSSLPIVLAFFLCVCSCQELTQQNALPLASLPLPENDDQAITVSTPDEIGYITVKGSNSLIPTDHVLIVTVNLPDSADAEENCIDDIPHCPTLNPDRQCHFEKQTNETHFEFRLPANIEDTVLFSFSHVTTCESEPVAEAIIDQDDTRVALEKPIIIPMTEKETISENKQTNLESTPHPIDQAIKLESKPDLDRIETYDEFLYHRELEFHSIVIAALYPESEWDNLYFGLIIRETESSGWEIIKRVQICHSPGDLHYQLMPLKPGTKPAIQILCDGQDDVHVLELMTWELIRRIPFEQSLFNKLLWSKLQGSLVEENEF